MGKTTSPNLIQEWKREREMSHGDRTAWLGM
jgi:hypothetical protein